MNHSLLTNIGLDSFVSIDVETTGLDLKNDKIIEIISSEASLTIDYISVVDSQTLEEIPVEIEGNVLVCTAVWIAPLQEVPVFALAWGMFTAGCIQVLIQIYPLIKLRLLPKFNLNLKHPGVRKVMYLMVPGIIAGGVSQLNMLVDTILASFLPTGSPSWLYVSDRLMQLPLGIFAIAIATVILPRLSSLHQTESKKEFSKTIDWSIRLVLLAGFPAIIGLVVLSEPIILTLFERGEFSIIDTSKASPSLIALALGLIAFMLIKVLTPGFFARQNPQTPVKIALASMLVNAVLAYLLAFYFGLNHVGLAIASSFAAYFSVFILLAILLKNRIYQIEKGWFIFLSRLIISCLVMYGIVVWINIDTSSFYSIFEKLDINDETIVVPGHGPVSTTQDIQTYIDMLIVVRDRIQSLIDTGSTLEEIIATDPTREWRDKFGEGPFIQGLVDRAYAGMIK